MVKLLYLPRHIRSKGFTIVELLVVLSVIALLLSIITPRYLNKIDEGQEVVLRQNLAMIRHSIDQYYADQGVYPDNLKRLIEKRYLREIPLDPVTKSNVWRTITDVNSGVGIYDVKSMSEATGSDERAYSQW